ncbi:PH and SEC7 domain-containing protein 1-like [Silurus meridionalis]|uniref:PH and SEC7 domain-containing protein 1-like n=1 Tax=Silurus meridionalis TaxID=175797 RepID=UPI001EEB6012|nr:PH and SEC7 domain-containing protein 1-like [Silurus meridionalis]
MKQEVLKHESLIEATTQSLLSSVLKNHLTQPGSDEVAPGASGQEEVAPGASGHVEVAPGASGQVEVEPGASGQEEVSSGASGQEEVSPGASGQEEVAPGASGHVEVSPGASGHVEVAPGASGHVEVAPGSSGQVEVSPGALGHVEVAPGASGHVEVSPGASGHVEVAPGALGHVEVAPGASGQVDVAPGASGHVEFAPGASGQEDVTPGASGHVEVSPGASGHVEVAPGALGHVEVAPGSSGQVEVSPGASGHVEFAPGASGQEEVAPGASGHVEVSPGASGHVEVAPGALGHVEVAPGSSGQVDVAPGASGQVDVAPGASGHVEVAPGASGQEEVAPGASGQEEVAPQSTEWGEVARDMSDQIQLLRLIWEKRKIDLKGKNLARQIYNFKHFRSPEMIQQLSNNLELAQSFLNAYVMHFNFTSVSIDLALRMFLRVLWPEDEFQLQHHFICFFSLWYLKCNERALNLHQGVYNLCWAMILLNADLHGGQKRKMTCKEFIDNLNSVSDQSWYPEVHLKNIYKSIKACPLYAFRVNSRYEENDEEYTVYKTGQLMCKRVMDANGRKTRRCRRSWKHFSATLNGLLLQLDSEDDCKNITISLHHAVAHPLKYKNMPYLLFLKTADSRVFYFQTDSEVEQRLWVSTINLIAARFSAPPLTSNTHDINKPRPQVLPSFPSTLSLEQQFRYTKDQLEKVSEYMSYYQTVPFRKDAPHLDYIKQEVKRYTTYMRVLEKSVRHDVSHSCEVEEK